MPCRAAAHRTPRSRNAPRSRHVRTRAASSRQIRNCTGSLPRVPSSIECEYVGWDTQAARMLAVWVGVFSIVVIVILVGIVVQRHNKHVRRAQPLLSALCCVGAVVIDMSFFVAIGKPSQSICVACLALNSLGYTLLLGVLLVRTYRIYRIIAISNATRVLFTDAMAVRRVLLLLVAQCVVLGCSLGAWPLKTRTDTTSPYNA